MDVNRAYIQASELEAYAGRLEDTKNSLYNYKNGISNEWSAEEVAHLASAIDEQISYIDDIKSMLYSLQSDIRSVAEEIEEEEEEAEAEAAAAALAAISAAIG